MAALIMWLIRFRSEIQQQKPSMKKIFKITCFLLLLLVLVLAAADYWVIKSAASNLYTSAESIPHNKVGLLLGTGKFLKNGRLNLYYQYRLDAAVRLFEAGKIEHILVSGDNSQEGYDEPTDFKNDLIARGIPAENIHLDYAGFRTLDSVVRSKAIFGQHSITVISQPFHNERALFIAQAKGISAVGFNAQDVGMRFGLKVQLREKLARVKVLLDIALGKEPKFFGEEIGI
jgi:SanA protein